MIGINASLFACWRFFSMTRHSCQGFSRTLYVFWQEKQLQSEVCWLLSKYSSLFHNSIWQTVGTLTILKTNKAPLISRKGMSNHQIPQVEACSLSDLKRCFETHNMGFSKAWKTQWLLLYSRIHEQMFYYFPQNKDTHF